jgi:hypothetical protein
MIYYGIDRIKRAFLQALNIEAFQMSGGDFWHRIVFSFHSKDWPQDSCPSLLAFKLLKSAILQC